MKRINHFLINNVIKIIEIISSALNYKLRGKAASIIGSIIYLISGKRKKIAFENLSRAYPEKSKTWIKKTTADSFRNIAITYFELLAQHKQNQLKVETQIRYDNIDLILKAYKHGKGVILLSGHFGNWELLALSAGLFSGIPVLVVVQKQRYWDKQISESRTKFGNMVVERGTAARKLITTLRNNGVIALLADQSPPPKDGVMVDFFGRKTLTYKAPAELALKFGSIIIAGFAVREKDFTYSVVLEEIDHEDLDYSDEGIQKLTQRYSSLLEGKIRENPHLWAWQHRRWKNSPDSEK